jgi:hypothetical protein
MYSYLVGDAKMLFQYLYDLVTVCFAAAVILIFDNLSK